MNAAQTTRLKREIRREGVTLTKPAWRVAKRHPKNWREQLVFIRHKSKTLAMTPRENSLLRRMAATKAREKVMAQHRATKKRRLKKLITAIVSVVITAVALALTLVAALCERWS